MCYDACAQMATFPGLLLGHEFEDGEYDEARGPADPLRDFIPIGDISREMISRAPEHIEITGLDEMPQDSDDRLLAEDDVVPDADPPAHLLAEEERGNRAQAEQSSHDGEFEFSEERVVEKHYERIEIEFDRLLEMRGVPGDESLRVAHSTQRVPNAVCDPFDRHSKTDQQRQREHRGRKPLRKEKRTTIRRGKWVIEHELLVLNAKGKVIDYYVEEKFTFAR